MQNSNNIIPLQPINSKSKKASFERVSFHRRDIDTLMQFYSARV